MQKALVVSALLVTVLLPSRASAAGSSANVLPNASFEQGHAAPDDWSVFTLGAGGWEYNGHDGGRCVNVTGYGDDLSWWTPTRELELQANRLYHLSYWVRRGPQSTGGVAIAGLDWLNRDSRPQGEWGKRGFFFRTPDAVLSKALFRLGQWHVKGTIFFDDATLTPAVAVHRRPAGLDFRLGAGEQIVAGRYRASHLLGGPGATDFRCLERFTAHFNTDRWVFDLPADAVYRHRVGRLRQTESEVEVRVNLWEKGLLVVEGSGDGKKWVKLGEIGKVGQLAFPLPADLLPSREVWIRLRSVGESEFQVNGYEYSCRLPEAESVERAIGETQYLALVRAARDLDVEVRDMGSLRPGEQAEVSLFLENRGPRRSLELSLVIEKDGSAVSRSETRASLAPGGSRSVSLPYELEAGGGHSLTIRCLDAESGSALWESHSEFTVPPLHDARGGKLLYRGQDLAIWWCEPERKVSRGRPAPSERGTAVRISAAANEYEGAQLVLTPGSSPLSRCRVRASDLVAESGARIPASEIEIRTVEYVFVEEPTDDIGAVGEWPDPLPLHDAPVDLAPGRNQPFWITVHVSAGTPGGEYRGQLVVEGEGLSQTVPLQVHVWDFELPRETHVRSGFGLWPWEIGRYHNLDTDEDLREVFASYLRSFAEHRVAPFSFGRRIRIEWNRNLWEGVEPRLDFAGFDEDARFALDELGFNSFRLDLEGLGGGTFHSRHAGEIEGLKQGTREYESAFTSYARAVQDHLEERGWLDEAYVYWFDEPAEKDFDFVREGMELIHRAAPKLTRLLTTDPDPRLYGAVDLWCLPTYTLEPDAVRTRQARGEEVWWYLCTAPKAPYFTLFLDHYGTEMRVWLWETWKYGLDGILVWQTNYWTSDNAYPRPEQQDPWKDPMSWKSGYGLGRGEREPWGNGDGRLLYPPKRDPADHERKHPEGPVPSIRWELLRDGIEDYEYFWLLREEIARLKESGADPSVYYEAEQLLEIPAEVCSDLTQFATTPEPIHEHRAKVAEAIERLREHPSF